jgi:superfamily II DNA or RNA helicase
VYLRPYQQAAVDEIHARVRRGTRRIVVVAPTGSGKTTIAAHLIVAAVAKGSHVLFMAHRRELIGQAYNRLVQMGVPEGQLGVMMGDDQRRRPGAPVQVASVDTLRNRAKPRAEVVFVDECHRALSKSIRDISACYPNAVHLGLTATPFRADGSGLGDVYDDLLLVASPRQLIAEGHLVEPRVFTVPPDALPDLSAVRVQHGDYDQRALAEAVDSKRLVGNLVEHWLRHARELRTVAFAVSVAHSRHIVEQFRQAGIAAEHLDGTTPAEERDATLARLERGETRVVANCSLFAEGWDQPAVKCAILARPTRSTGLYLQQAGRILRPYQGQQAIILDHGGCVLEHGLPQDDRAYSLEGTKKKRGGPSEAPVRTCPTCFAVLPLTTRVCPECDTILITAPEVPKERAGTLVEITSAELRRAELRRLQAIADKRGYKPGWVYYRYKERFGEAPPGTQPGPPPTIDGHALHEVLQQAARSGARVDWETLAACARPGAP